MESFAAPMATAPMVLPDGFAEAVAAARPTRAPGEQPLAAVLLVEFEILETAG